MARKLKFELMTDETSRASSLKRKRLGLVKKVRELSILCDVRACLVMFSPNEVEPTVWPSPEVARVLLKDFMALPDFMRKKKETTVESYMKEKISSVQESLKKTQKENVDQLMVQISGGRKIHDLRSSEIYSLLSFSKDAIMKLRKKLDYIEHAPLREPPVYPFELQGQENERASIGTLKGNQSYYLMDEWIFPSFIPPSPQIHQENVMNTASYNETPDPRCDPSYHSYRAGFEHKSGHTKMLGRGRIHIKKNSSNGNHHLEMELTCSPRLVSYGVPGSVSQPFQHPHNINNIPTMAMNQQKPFLFDVVSHEERSNVSMSSNTLKTNDGLGQEPPPPPVNEETVEEANDGAKSFDVKMDWLGFNNHHF